MSRPKAAWRNSRRSTPPRSDRARIRPRRSDQGGTVVVWVLMTVAALLGGVVIADLTQPSGVEFLTPGQPGRSLGPRPIVVATALPDPPRAHAPRVGAGFAIRTRSNL